MIIFKTLTIEGFGSILGPFTMEFEGAGLTLIKGENGVGKTTIFSALFWTLYGQTLKNKNTVLTWEHLRPPSYKGAKVTLELRIRNQDFTILRCQEYSGEIVPGVKGLNRLMVLNSEGKDIYSEKSKPQVQALISDSLIRMSSDLFKSSIVFGQRMKRLIEEDGPTKKKIFEEAFNVDYINKAKDLAFNKAKEYEKEMIPLDKAHFAKISAVDGQKNYIAILEEKQKNHEIDKAQEINKLSGEITELRAKLKKAETHKEEYKTLTTTIAQETESLKKAKNKFDTEAYYDLMNKVARLSTTMDNYERGLANAEKKLQAAQKSKLCPTCGAEMEGDKRKIHQAEIQSEIDNYTKELAEAKKAISGHKTKLASLLKQDKHIKSLTTSLETLEERLSDCPYSPEEVKSLVEKIKDKKAQKKKVRETSINFGVEEAKSDLDRLEKEAKVLGKALRKATKKYQVQEWLYTKALSNSGLKAFIFNQMLDKLNAILKDYSKQLGIRPYFIVDMESARKDILAYAYINGMPVSFNDLSGGQAQLANIITAFATHDLIAKGKFNILVLDEVFESLSSTNVELVSEMINPKTHKQQVFLITHLNQFKPTGAHTLEFTLQDGVTRPLL